MDFPLSTVQMLAHTSEVQPMPENYNENENKKQNNGNWKYYLVAITSIMETLQHYFIQIKFEFVNDEH